MSCTILAICWFAHMPVCAVVRARKYGSAGVADATAVAGPLHACLAATQAVLSVASREKMDQYSHLQHMFDRMHADYIARVSV